MTGGTCRRNRIGFGAGHGKEGKTEIAYPPEHSVQGGLVDDRTGEEGDAVRLQRERHARKVTSPAWAEMTQDPDLIDRSWACFRMCA